MYTFKAPVKKIPYKTVQYPSTYTVQQHLLEGRKEGKVAARGQDKQATMGWSALPQNSYVEVLPPVAQNVTLVTADVIS